MAHTTAHQWSKQITEHSERPGSGAYRSPVPMFTSHIGHAGAQLQPAEKQLPEEVRDEPRKPGERPASGRTTALGRKVEKPGSGDPAGPSGQRDRATHDGGHTNK